jgi:hypothetical protein
MLQNWHSIWTIQRSRGDAAGAGEDSGAKRADAREHQQDQILLDDRSDTPLTVGGRASR